MVTHMMAVTTSSTVEQKSTRRQPLLKYDRGFQLRRMACAGKMKAPGRPYTVAPNPSSQRLGHSCTCYCRTDAAFMAKLA
jgi:hypothetical protein